MPLEAHKRLHKEGPEQPHAQIHIGHGNRPPLKLPHWMDRQSGKLKKWTVLVFAAVTHESMWQLDGFTCKCALPCGN